MSRWTAALCALMLLAAGYGAGLGIGLYFRPSPYPSTSGKTGNNQQAPSTDELMKDLERRYELLKLRLDASAESSRHLDRLITVLLTVTTLYALALGLNSYFGLKQILDAAKEDSKRTFDGIREQYPEFANLHANLNDLWRA